MEVGIPAERIAVIPYGFEAKQVQDIRRYGAI